MKKISRIIHSIWFGSFPKGEALANIKNTIDIYPDYVCYLWSSPLTLSPVEWSVLESRSDVPRKAKTNFHRKPAWTKDSEPFSLFFIGGYIESRSS